MRGSQSFPGSVVVLCIGVVLTAAKSVDAQATTDIVSVSHNSAANSLPKFISLVGGKKSSEANASERAAKSHPLWPAFETAVDSYRHLRRNVRDYSCSLVRQERVNGRLRPAELMTAKVRHERRHDGNVVVPFAVYLKVLAPKSIKEREVLFVEAQHDGNMFVRNGGQRFAFVTARVKPDSPRAMRENRYPITDFGLENLVARLIEVVREDIQLGVETQVEDLHDASIDGRSCTGIRVTHPTFDKKLKFHRATVLIDDEYRVPVHYEAYDWPRTDDEQAKPRLLERYTYRDIRWNVGYSDQDFDPSNPSYKLK